MKGKRALRQTAQILEALEENPNCKALKDELDRFRSVRAFDCTTAYLETPRDRFLMT